MAKRRSGGTTTAGGAPNEAAEVWSGDLPLPAPDVLAQYEKVAPGFAQRFLDSWEQQGAHRREMEREVLVGQLRSQQRAQPLALAFGAAGLWAGTAIAIWANVAAGVAVAVAMIVAFVAANLMGAGKADRQLSANAAAVPDPSTRGTAKRTPPPQVSQRSEPKPRPSNRSKSKKPRSGNRR